MPGLPVSQRARSAHASVRVVTKRWVCRELQPVPAKAHTKFPQGCSRPRENTCKGSARCVCLRFTRNVKDSDGFSRHTRPSVHGAPWASHMGAHGARVGARRTPPGSADGFYAALRRWLLRCLAQMASTLPCADGIYAALPNRMLSYSVLVAHFGFFGRTAWWHLPLPVTGEARHILVFWCFW